MHKASQKSPNYLWKKLNIEGNKQMNSKKPASIPQIVQRSEMHEEKINFEDANNNQNIFLDFLNEAKRTGIPIGLQQNQSEDMDENSDHQINIDQKSAGQQNYQNNVGELAESIVQRLKMFKDEKTSRKNSSNSVPERQTHEINNKEQRKKATCRRIMEQLHGFRQEIKKISQQIQQMKDYFQLHSLVFCSKFRQLVDKINSRKTKEESTNIIRELKQKIQILGNIIRQKESIISKISDELESLKNENLQLNQKTFDLNQKIIQADLQLQQKFKSIIAAKKIKIETTREHKNGPFQVEALNFSNIEQKLKERFSDVDNIQEDSQSLKRQQQHRQSKNSSKFESERLKTDIDGNTSEQKKAYYDKLMPKGKYTISLQNTQNNIRKQTLNNDEISKRISEIKQKYQTPKPYSPKVEANVYKYQPDSKLSHIKSQTFHPYFASQTPPAENPKREMPKPQGYTSGYLNSSPSILSKTSSPKNHITISKGFNNSSSHVLANMLNRGNTRGYGYQNITHGVGYRDSYAVGSTENGNVSSQNIKIGRLGARIDELRDQIKRQIQATK